MWMNFAKAALVAVATAGWIGCQDPGRVSPPGAQPPEVPEAARPASKSVGEWIEQLGAPRYEDRNYPIDARRDRLCPIANPDGTDGALPIHQDASVHASILSTGKSVSYALGAGRGAWLQIARGAVEVLGQKLEAGDGASIDDEAELLITATEEAEFLLFDLD